MEYIDPLFYHGKEVCDDFFAMAFTYEDNPFMH